MIRKLPATLAAAALVALLTLTGCAPYVSPCTRLPAPTPQEIAVVNTGVEIEREIEGKECDLINGQWVEEESDRSTRRRR